MQSEIILGKKYRLKAPENLEVAYRHWFKDITRYWVDVNTRESLIVTPMGECHPAYSTVGQCYELAESTRWCPGIFLYPLVDSPEEVMLEILCSI